MSEWQLRVILAAGAAFALIGLFANVLGVPFGLVPFIPLVAAVVADWVHARKETRVGSDLDEEARQLYEEYGSKG
jgi:hypothetical protein